MEQCLGRGCWQDEWGKGRGDGRRIRTSAREIHYRYPTRAAPVICMSCLWKIPGDFISVLTVEVVLAMLSGPCCLPSRW